MNDVILAIDIGTTNIKCVVARRNMQFLADAECEYKTHSPEFLFYEQDCEDWWTHCKLAISRALAKAGTSAADVAAIAVSAQAPTFLPVARDGSPLCPAMIWMDRRSDRQCRQMELDFGREAIFRATGNVPDPFYMFGELLWFKENMPQQYEKTACVLQANGYVNYRLTGEMTIDRTNASITQCYNVINEDWDDAVLSKYGVSRAILPRIVDTDEVIGGVSAQASAETGIPAGTPVLGGAVDGAAAALEGGVSHQGRAVEMSGTSSVLLVGSESMHTSENLTYMYSAIRGQHLLLGCMSSTGGGLKWYRDNIFADKGEGCYAQMDRIIEKECPDPARIVFLPYLAGERAPIWDSHAKGAFLGLTFDTNQGEMLRAVEEGAAFALMDNLREALRSGATIETLRAVGGSVRSDIWMRIKASVTNMPIEIPKSSLGAPGGLLAILGYRLGEYASIQEAVDANLQIERVVEPVPAWVPRYGEQFQMFKEYYRQLKGSFERADRMGEAQ